MSPGKELFMTGFMLWMSGTGLNIFTMMITGMAVWRPISNIISAYSSKSFLNGIVFPIFLLKCFTEKSAKLYMTYHNAEYSISFLCC